MYSKFKTFTAGLILSIIILGCGLKVGETIGAPTPAKVESASCIDLSIKNLKLFSSGDATDDQVSESVQCLQDVFIAFKNNIRGETKDAFTAREIITFIESNFLNSTGPSVFTNQLLEQIMKFKVAWVGGNQQFVHKKEIDKIVNSIALLKPDLVALNKSMKILTFKWQPIAVSISESEKETRFLQAKSDFLKIVKKLSAQFEATGNAYQLDDMVELVKELSKAIHASSATLEIIEKARPFIKKFKLILIGGDSSLQNQEWSRLGLTLNEGFFQILRMQYFLKDLKPNETAARWSGYQKIAVDLSGLLETLLISKETKVLANFEIAEIAETLQTIYPDLSLPISLWDGVGYIKVMLLGDSTSGRFGWSATDFSAFRLKIPSLFGQLASVLQTYESITKNHHLRTNLSYAEFSAAEKTILEAVENLSKLAEKPYNIYSLKGLIIEMSRGLLKDILILPENFESLFGVALNLKTLITGQQDNNLAVENFRLLLKVGARGFLNYLEYDLFLKPYPSDSIAYSTNLERLAENTERTLNYNLSHRVVPFFSNQDISQLILFLQAEKMIKTHIRQSSLEKVLNAFWQNVLNLPDLRLQNKVRPGFDLIALTILSDEFKRFIKLQIATIEVFNSQPTIAKSTLVEFVNHAITQNQDQLLTASLIETKQFLQTNVALNFDAHGFLKILTLDLGQYHLEDQKKSNLARAVGRIIIRSYAQDLARAQNLTGITLDEAQFALSQVSDLVVDLNLIENLNSNFVKSRFLESNLFLTPSDGNSIASFSEIHQLVIHISSGVSRAAMIKSKVIKLCSPVIGGIVLNSVVAEDCLIDFYANEVESFSGLPQFLAMKGQILPTDIKAHYLSLLKAAGHVQNEKKLVLVSDADLFPHIVQYIEMVFQRFDVNRDQVLDKDEALAAFPVYHDLIKDLTKDFNLSEKELPGVFIYLLKYSKAPNTLQEKIQFKIFINNPDKWIINSTRIDLGKIFNFIADSMKPKVPVP